MKTFLTMKWREHLNNQTGTNHAVDWSWLDKPKRLPSVARLLNTEWSDDRTKLMYEVGFRLEDIERTRYRMVMGALRYSMLIEEGFRTYTKEYYENRLAKELHRLLHTNLEGCYDGLNLLYLMYRCDYISETEYKVFTRQTCMLMYHAEYLNVPYKPVDRKE